MPIDEKRLRDFFLVGEGVLISAAVAAVAPLVSEAPSPNDSDRWVIVPSSSTLPPPDGEDAGTLFDLNGEAKAEAAN